MECHLTTGPTGKSSLNIKRPGGGGVLYYVTAVSLHRSHTKAPLFERVFYYVTAVTAAASH